MEQCPTQIPSYHYPVLVWFLFVWSEAAAGITNPEHYRPILICSNSSWFCALTAPSGGGGDYIILFHWFRLFIIRQREGGY